MKRVVPVLILAWLPQLAFANCALDQQFCRTECEVRHFTDDAAVTGCKARCAVQRAICSTGKGAETAVELGKEGADAAVEASKDAWEGTKSFIKGISEP
ncbi:hypothetical protein A8C75_05905 [Marinobacterium aestuarii]|uniref:Uncharacterized protein n=1 Tax=Marinobacterium aestuarii TaxID=1821621 RepID=A0A1A9EWR2_9GAMM|nr:hypothetical protein [Marinobacterium aestuarii]ANG62071.1 hypothetical protein A8C75_05905 [Marinobacterium aestuarii]